MPRAGIRLELRSARRAVAGLALALFALRVLVPAGFMPNLDAFGAGEFGIVLCFAHGNAPQPLAPGSGPAAPQKTPGADCPFGMALGKPFVAPDVWMTPPTATAFDQPIPVPRHATLVAMPRGPPLGPRAPPVFLG